MAGSADRIERQARARLASVALDLKPSEPAIEALRNGRRRLRWAAIGFHPDRPQFGLCAVGIALSLANSRACSARIFAPMILPPKMTSHFLVLMAGEMPEVPTNEEGAKTVRSAPHRYKKKSERRRASALNAAYRATLALALRYLLQCRAKFGRYSMLSAIR